MTNIWLKALGPTALIVFAFVACEQAGLPSDPNAQMPSADKIIQATDTRTRAAAQIEALPNSMSQSITGVVTLADGATAPEGGVLFVFARKPGITSGPPVAVAKFEVSSFPFIFELSKANVMIPKAPFEGPLVISARLDADGNAMTRGATDLSGQSVGSVQIGSANVPILLGGEGASSASAANAHSAASPAKAAAPAKATAGTGSSIKGRIELAAGAKPAPGAVVFVMARKVGVKGGPPLAALRLEAKSFPLDFSIGKGDVMMPGASLDGPVTVSARLDADGDAMSKGPNDLAGATSAGVSLGDEGVIITLAAP